MNIVHEETSEYLINKAFILLKMNQYDNAIDLIRKGLKNRIDLITSIIKEFLGFESNNPNPPKVKEQLLKIFYEISKLNKIRTKEEFNIYDFILSDEVIEEFNKYGIIEENLIDNEIINKINQINTLNKENQIVL